MKDIVYRFSSKFYPTAGLTKKLEHRVALLYPATRYSVIKKTQGYLIRVYISALLVMAGLMAFAEISLYYGCLVAVIVYVTVSSGINTALCRQEVKLLKLFEEFISEVHFHYQFNGMLYEAIEKAIGKVPYEMAIHGELLLSYLKNAYTGEGDDYREVAPDNLFLTFYSLSLTVLTYGDKTGEKGSVYLNNLGYLKENVNIEILKRRKLESQFAGLAPVTILPVFSIKLIELWAVSNMPELAESYRGFGGIVTTIILSLVTVGIYKIITLLRTPYHVREYKSGWAEALLNIDMLNDIIMLLIKKTRRSSERLNKLLKSIVYPYGIREFLLRRIVFSAAAGIAVPVVCASISMPWFICIPTGIAAYISVYEAIYFRLLIKRQIMIMDSEEEIVRYQSVILMLMHMDRITVEQILRQIRDFAVIFAEEVDSMIDRYSYMGMKVFEEVKEHTGFMPLEKLMDGFIAADLLGIERAFCGLEEERRYYIEKHKQENEDIIMKKSAFAKVLAFLPLCMIILVKLILPFVTEGMAQLSNTGL